MTRSQIESAIESDCPFSLMMADGREYSVPHRDYITLAPKSSYAIVFDDEGHYSVLPLLTMTGLRARERESQD